MNPFITNLGSRSHQLQITNTFDKNKKLKIIVKKVIGI